MNLFTFLSVIRQNFEYNLRILANFCLKIQKSFLIKIILFTLKIHFLQRKMPKVS